MDDWKVGRLSKQGNLNFDDMRKMGISQKRIKRIILSQAVENTIEQEAIDKGY